MKIKVVWLSYYPEVPAQDYWDMTMLKDIFSGDMWKPVNGFEFEDVFSLDDVPEEEGAIVVIPARYHHRDIEKINADIAPLPWVIMMIIGDEESAFPSEKLSHPKMKLWVMTPIPGRHKADHFLPHGYTPDTRQMLGKYDADIEISLDWFFAGQVTHNRRKSCVGNIRNVENGYLVETDGFAHGISHEAYYAGMVSAKAVPCPSGPMTPDSFRVCEALEAGCIPIADDCTPNANYPKGYWTNVFQECEPFYVVRKWESFPGYMKDILDHWPENANRVFAWWQAYKKRLAYDVVGDLNSFGLTGSGDDLKDLITVLMPTSAIASHPSTSIIENAVSTARYWLPGSEIFIMIDGLRPELAHYRSRYSEYIRRLLWKCNHEWSNVLPLIFDRHSHQARMTRETLLRVKTPLILFMEHDTPLCEDREIDWRGICSAIMTGDADMVRFHYAARIDDDHQYLMMDRKPKKFSKVPLIRTVQWSQRPHLASASFYRRILRDNFSENALTMIEDRMHSVVQVHCKENPGTGWNDYRLAIYAPDGNMQRSYHIDGRGVDLKYEESFRY